MKRRTFIPLSIAAVAGCRRSASITDWHPAMNYEALAKAGDAVEITWHCLGRIDTMDRVGLGIRAVIEVNPDAERIAAECVAKGAAGPLQGLPI
ncbi:MAG: hypothetical protein KDK97_21585 [Verrucomicrobiales bacterium]|nr:hypothetical protein [Verrucomicrobiales bacterium]